MTAKIRTFLRNIFNVGAAILLIVSCDSKEHLDRADSAQKQSPSTFAQGDKPAAAVPVAFDIKPLLGADGKKGVWKVVGKPLTHELCCSTDSDPKFLIESYKWGRVRYDVRGVVDEVSYYFPGYPNDQKVKPGIKRPHSTREALEMVCSRPPSL